MFTSAIGNEVNSTTNSPIVTQPSNRPSQGENHHPFSAHTVSCTKDELKIRRKLQATPRTYDHELAAQQRLWSCWLRGPGHQATRIWDIILFTDFCQVARQKFYTFSCCAWLWNVDLICARRFARIKRSLRQVAKKKYRLRNFRKMIG